MLKFPYCSFSNKVCIYFWKLARRISNHASSLIAFRLHVYLNLKLWAIISSYQLFFNQSIRRSVIWLRHRSISKVALVFRDNGRFFVCFAPAHSHATKIAARIRPWPLFVSYLILLYGAIIVMIRPSSFLIYSIPFFSFPLFSAYALNPLLYDKSSEGQKENKSRQSSRSISLTKHSQIQNR